MNPLIQSAVGSILRAGLMVLATWLTQHGIWSESDAAKYVDGIVVALLSLGWSYRKIIANRVLFLTALMPGPKTEAEVIAHIESGNATPSILTPPNTVPGVPSFTNLK